MEAEKRKTERFAVRGGAFVAFGNGLPKVGMLKDISKGGLSFEYLCYEKPVGNDKHVDIWMTEAESFRQEVPCEKMYDKILPQNMEYLFPTTTIMRRCGIKFGPLSADQSAKLSSFIDTYATQPAP